jgi:hypothetical protein
MTEILRRQNLKDFFAIVFLTWLQGVSAGIFHKALVLVDESERIRPQTGKHNRGEDGCSAWDTLCNTTR